MKRNSHKIASLFLAITGIVSAVAAQDVVATDDIRPKVDEYMNARLAAKNVGGSIMIAKNGQMIVSKGFGLADVAANTPIYGDTKFRIGSITKQFTAASILLLQEDGKLNVEDPFCNYMESCPDAWKPVTIRNLATMSSGIPSFTGLPEFRELRKKDMKPAESIGLVKDLPLKAKPGEVFEYSNTNYIILGMIVEKLSGKTYEQFLADRITKPLGLKNTGYDHGKERLKLSALGYSLKEDAVVPAEVASMMVPFSAGSLYSTTGDLHKWNVALHGGKLYKKPETLTLMLTPSKNDYAFGLNVRTDSKGRKRISHGGGIEGFLSEAAYYPNDKLFMAVLVNNDRAPAGEVIRTLTAIYDGDKYVLPKKRVAVKVDVAILDKYVGEYEMSPEMKFKFTREGDGLVLLPTGQSKAQVYAESDTEFFLKVVEASFKFEKDASGKVTGIEFTQGGRTSKMRKL
ncbi:MAG: serine hydrolase [Pyrinomonadaceae bacterium]